MSATGKGTGASGRGGWIPWLFVAFFAVVVAANATMVWIGVSSWTGLATDSAYDKGLAYNRNLAAARAQAELGWRPRLEARMAGEGRAELLLTVRDRDGDPIADARVEGELRRPSRAADDRDVVLRPDAPGRYRARVDLPSPGAWDAHLRITRGADRYVLDERLVLR